MNHKITAAILLIIAVSALTTGYIIYSANLSNNNTSAPPTLRTFIASSLINVATNMTNEFNNKNNCNITLNSAGSNTLYQQIIAGSPCDVFMSADFKWTKQLDSYSLLKNGYQNFTKNSLEILIPQDNPQNITSLLDLIKPGVKIVIADATVPVGSYTNATLTKIEATWGNSSSPQYLGPEWQNYRSRFLDNVVSYEISVEAVVGKVALGLGIVDAGVAFVSDATYGALTGAKLAYVQIPNSVNTVGTYGIAVTKETNHSDLAQKYVDFWTSNEGQEILYSYGFGI